MKAAPLLVQWHNDHAPIYSVHFEPSGKGRLATSGGDNNVRIWKVNAEGEERKITYLSTLMKHTQAVNVVRFAPKGMPIRIILLDHTLNRSGEVLATAGDDGNTLLWVPSDTLTPAFGEEGLEDKETWRVKHMCRSGYEIYDLAWSPDASYFIIGSIDNVARIYNASNGSMVRQIAEHNHYVQGVTWDPLNEYVATQSSDRSVHIYNLRTKDGKFTLDTHNKVSKMDLPGKITHGQTQGESLKGALSSVELAPASPAPSASIPGTPTSLALPMNPPALTHSRRSSFASSPFQRRSASPAPSMPLPAVRPMENSPLPFTAIGNGFKNTNIYANETYTSFFRRLTFTPDGSLLFTPAGQYKVSHPSIEGSKSSEEIINTVYIYTRAGLNKPPITHLPGHKKASIAVKCSPIFYTLRQGIKSTVQITLDTSSADEAIPALPEPIVPTSAPSPMNPPRSTTMPSPKDVGRPTSSPREGENGVESAGPISAFALPYRMVYAVATQDSVLVYDTQQTTPLCVVSNLHFTTFTDLTWANDGLTLLMSSSDGFCSTITFAPGELGLVYTGTVPHASSTHQTLTIGTSQSAQPSPVPTPTGSTAPSFQRLPSTGAFASPNPHNPGASPTKSRSNSVSSIATQSSFAQPPSTSAMLGNSPTPIIGNVPGVTAGNNGSLSFSTPPATPMSAASLPVGTSAATLGKRDSISTVDADEEERQPKKRRIAPTPVANDNKS